MAWSRPRPWATSRSKTSRPTKTTDNPETSAWCHATKPTGTTRRIRSFLCDKFPGVQRPKHVGLYRAPRRSCSATSVRPVFVSRERVIRTDVGLRPFRPSGFLVRAELLGDKLLVHNYGHGGAGVTLSWGTAHLALEEVTKSGRKGPAAVLGCGAVGLAAARLLQSRGFEVTIYAKESPSRDDLERGWRQLVPVPDCR
jgi:hypothetical protein